MYCYSARVRLPAGQPLGGYGELRHSQSASDALAVHAIGVNASVSGEAFELCAIDALYAGDLVRVAQPAGATRIFAASHTHTAPMLDSTKPWIGAMAREAVHAFEGAIRGASARPAAVEHCDVYRAEWSWPVYRRFDLPRSSLNVWLARHAGLYPNDAVPIDRGIRLFVFGAAGHASFALIYLACHPVTRHDVNEVSADYVQALRHAAMRRFGVECCLFLQGCAGDVRPNFARKRFGWLPPGRLNWRFAFPPSVEQQAAADRDCAAAVEGAVLQRSFGVSSCDFALGRRRIDIVGLGAIEIRELRIGGELVFRLLPFELSHLYHLQAQQLDPRVFLVSCVDEVRGYLPHPSQWAAGGYEVDASRRCMGLHERICATDPTLWQYA